MEDQELRDRLAELARVNMKEIDGSDSEAEKYDDLRSTVAQIIEADPDGASGVIEGVLRDPHSSEEEKLEAMLTARVFALDQAHQGKAIELLGIAMQDQSTLVSRDARDELSNIVENHGIGLLEDRTRLSQQDSH